MATDEVEWWRTGVDIFMNADLIGINIETILQVLKKCGTLKTHFIKVERMCKGNHFDSNQHGSMIRR